MRHRAPGVDLQLFAEERREPATARRRQKARQSGDVRISRELTAAFALLLAFIALRQTGPALADRLAAWAASVWQVRVREWTPGEVRALGLGAAAAWALAAGPMLAAGVVGAVLAGLGQTGFALAPARVQPRPAALDPVAGFRRLLSLRTLAEMVRSLVKLAVLAVVAASVLRDLPAELPVLPLTAPTEGVRHFAAVLDALVGRAAVAFLALAAADLAYQRWQYERDLRMSRQEVREELKETEGDPAVRGRRRRLQRELARQRMLRDVARAHVVVTNPIHYAVALRYEPLSMEAPVVLARGRGLLARRIREQARRYGVTVVENAALARGLYYATRVGQPIPAAFYQAVAEVLAFVWRLKRYRLPELPVGREMRR